MALGVVDKAQVSREFADAFGSAITDAYLSMAVAAAADAALPPALDAARQAGDQATTRMVEAFATQTYAIATDRLRAVQIGAVSMSRFRGRLAEDFLLTARQSAWADSQMARLLRGKLRGDNQISRSRTAAHLEGEVATYRHGWAMARTKNAGEAEALRAANFTWVSVYAEAEAAGALPRAYRKSWMHRHVSTVRDSHLQIPELNPNGVALDGAFVTPLGHLRYPGDPAGVIDDIVGCQCLAIVGPEE